MKKLRKVQIQNLARALLDFFLSFSALKGDKERRNYQHQVLILGCGEAGKSTFIKQMQIINSNGFPEKAKHEQKRVIAQNIMDAIRTLMQNMVFAEEAQIESDSVLWEAFQKVDAMPDFMPETVYEHADAIKALWLSEPIQATFSRRNQFQLLGNAYYFLPRVHEVMEASYVPSNEDILQARVQTIGIVKYEFQMDKKQTVTMV